jgi:putative lysine transport system ATP-binding protein
MSEQILSVNHLSKSFGKNVVLKDIDFSVEKGDVTSIIGASGSGKSTLLRCINLLETPTAGQILFHDDDITRRGYNVPAYRAKVGMVFQNFNLFNNMTVLDNCMVGLIRVMHKDRATAEQLSLIHI